MNRSSDSAKKSQAVEDRRAAVTPAQIAEVKAEMAAWQSGLIAPLVKEYPDEAKRLLYLANRWKSPVLWQMLKEKLDAWQRDKDDPGERKKNAFWKLNIEACELERLVSMRPDLLREYGATATIDTISPSKADSVTRVWAVLMTPVVMMGKNGRKTKSKPTIIYHGAKAYSIGEHAPIALLESEHNALQPFIENSCLTGPELADKTGNDDSPKALRKLTTKYKRRFAPAINCPVKKGSGGYSVAIRNIS